MDVMKKIELQKIINSEHGVNYHRNINLSGYTVYRDKSFITFRMIDVNKKKITIIDYMYITTKKDLIQLLAWCINFWSGNAIKYVYYKEHHRNANIIEKCLPALGFTIQKSAASKWKYNWTSTNGYDENDIIEAYTTDVAAK